MSAIGLVEKRIIYILCSLTRMQENTDQKKLRIWTLFTQCFCKHFQEKWVKINCKSIINVR